MYNSIFAFGDSHVAGDELILDNGTTIPGLANLKPKDFSNKHRTLQNHNTGFLGQYYKTCCDYYGGADKLEALEKEMCFVASLARKLNVTDVKNFAKHSSSNLKIFYTFLKHFPFESTQNILLIVGITEINRSAKFINNEIECWNPIWFPQDKNALQYIDLNDTWGNDTVMSLYSTYSIILAIKNMVSSNVKCVFLDTNGNFLTDSYADEPSEEYDIVITKIKKELLPYCMLNFNIPDRHPRSHFTLSHHNLLTEKLFNDSDINFRHK